MRKILMAAMLVAGVQGAQAADMPDYALRGGYNDGLAGHRALWDGFYVGGQASQSWVATSPPAGYNAALINSYQTFTGLSGAFPGLTHGSGDKAGYGGFVGYNGQFEDVVVGVEASYLHSTLSGNSNSIGNTYAAGVLTSTARSNLAVAVKDMGSVRLRGGYMIGNFLPYAFIGAAGARADYAQSVGVSYLANLVTPLPPFSTFVQRDRMLYGYSAGVGLDVNLVGGLFARIEYEYMRFTSRIETNVNSVRAGLGYKF